MVKCSLGRAVLVAVLLALPAGASAQLTTGTISGAVTDSTAAILPGATVTVQNVDTGLSRTLVSNTQGRYEAPNLPIGRYQIRAELQGFKTTQRSGINLTVGRNAVVDLVLEVGALSETVTVSGEAALVDTTSPTVSTVVDQKRVAELPLMDRDLTQLTFLQPGVIRMNTGTGTFGGMGAKLTVAGSRGNQNVFLIDGVSSNDVSGNPQGASGGMAGAETIQEFQIITNNYSAEYRSQAGAIISAVTKSGTNRLRGSLFEFHRNDSLDEPNYFAKAFNVEQPEFRRNQFGGTIGGPILQNRTFFFFGYEGLRQDLGETSSIRVPTVAARQGILPTGTVAVNPIVVPYLNMYPVPGNGNTLVEDFGDGTARVAGESTENLTGDLFSLKIDHRFTGGKAGAVSGTYMFDDSMRTNHDLVDSIGTASRRHVLSIKHTSILTPTTLSEINVGYSNTMPHGQIPIEGRDWQVGNLVFVPGQRYMGEIGVPSLVTLGSSGYHDEYYQRAYSISQNLSFTLGRHSLRTGLENTWFRYYQQACPNGCYGEYTFRSLAHFLQGNPRRLDVALPPSVPEKWLSQLFFGAYVQDNFRITDRLTLSAGLRYEYSSVPKERNGNTSRITDLSLRAPAETINEIGTLYNNPMTKAFSPRVGFAWATRDERTSVRGGVGVYYEHPMFYQIRTALQEQQPFNRTGRLDDTQANRAGRPLRFPDAFATQQDMLAARIGMRGFQYDLDTSYGYRWSLTVQRQFWNEWVTTIGYTGSSFMNLWWQGQGNINMWEGYPEQPDGPKFFPAGTALINPDLGEARIQYSNADSDYHGMTAGLQKRLSSGLQLQVSYTLSKVVDEGSGVTSTGESFPQGQRWIYAYDTDLRRGLSSFDVRNNFSANFSYELPWGQGLTGASRALVHGWQINGVLTLSDGTPLTVIDSRSVQEDRIGDNEGLRPDLIPGGNPNPVLGGPTLYFDPTQFAPSQLGYFGTLPRNTVIGPGLATFDMSFFKNIALGSARMLNLRFEVFNAFNRANFGTPNMSPWLANGSPNAAVGTITSTRTPGRQMQLGMRFAF